MTGTRFHQLLAGIIDAELGWGRDRALLYAAAFTNLSEFYSVPKSKLAGPKGVSGQPMLRLKPGQINALHRLRERMKRSQQPAAEAYISAVTRRFATRQVEMIRAMTFEDLNVNPILVKALNIHSPTELVGLHVEMATTRSIVTSMGFYLEQVVWASSDAIEKAPPGSNWDFKLTRAKCDHWLQLKSGPNDIDKDQISHWVGRIQEKIQDGSKAYLGFIYGKKSAASVSMGLLKRYLPDWELRVLVGRELWAFVSGDPLYHVRLCNILRQAALTVLHRASIVTELKKAAKRMTKEFQARYGNDEEAVEQYIREIL